MHPKTVAYPARSLPVPGPSGEQQRSKPNMLPPRRKWTANAVLAIGLALLASSSAMAAEWAARHGLTGAQYQQAFNDYSKKGFRLASVSGYESGGSARYAALWTKQAGNAWSARHGLTPQQYQSAFEDFAKQGYRLTFVNGYAVGG